MEKISYIAICVYISSLAILSYTNTPISNVAMPVRFVIPSIGIDSEVEIVTTTADNEIGSPKDKLKVGWYNQSVLPGETGTSIIDGHYGWKDSKDSVFDNLTKINVGDEVSVTNSDGKTHTYLVYDTRIYSEDDNTDEVVYTVGNGKYLNLITCGGVWNAGTKSYSQRLVVFSKTNN